MQPRSDRDACHWKVHLCWVASDLAIQPSYFTKFLPEYAVGHTDHRKRQAANSVKHDHVQLICCSVCAPYFCRAILYCALPTAVRAVRPVQVCWDKFVANREWVLFQCQHGTCVPCYQRLLQQPSGTASCPLCRLPLMEPAPSVQHAQPQTLQQ